MPLLKDAHYTSKEYWIVNPVKEWVTVYRYEEDVAPTNYTFA